MENSEKNFNDEILDRMAIQLGELDKRLANLPDYTQQLETLSKGFDRFLQQYHGDQQEIKTIIRQPNADDPQKQVQTMLTETRAILESIKKLLPLKLINTFNLKTKGWIISGAILLIVVALSTGLSGYLWKENSRLEAADFKYRLAKQVGPTVTNWADSIYLNDPEEAKRILTKMEAKSSLKNELGKPNRSHSLKKPRKKRRY
jgi:hypothetical protein